MIIKNKYKLFNNDLKNKEMEMLKRKRNTQKEATVAVKDEIEYLDEKNPFYDSDDNSLPR